MKWTEELETLASQVKARLGDLAASEAFHRALAKAHATGLPPAPESLLGELSEQTGAASVVLQPGTVEDALKAELLALLRTH